MSSERTLPVEPWRFADRLEQVRPGLPEALVDGEAYERLLTLARLAMPWPRVTYALETRLGPTAGQVDLAFCATSAEELDSFVRATATTSPTWTALTRLATRLADPAVGELLADVWLEFDLDQAVVALPEPALFLGPRALRRRRDHREPAFGDQVTALVALLREVADAAGVPFDAAALCRAIELLPDGAKVFQVGLMLSRRPVVVRLVVQRLAPAAIPDYLTAVGREAYAGVARSVLADCAGPGHAIDLQLELGPDSGRALGLELVSKKSGANGAAGWAQLGERLVAMGLCAADKLPALLAWSAASPRRWLSHLKVVCAPSGPLEAKGYLFFDAAAADPAAEPSVRPEFERVEAGEQFFDYCHFRYRPPKRPEGKLRAVELLYHSFAIAGAPPVFREFVDVIRKAIGVNQTVFGVKWIDGRLAWEFYFYDYARQQRRVGVSTFLRLAEPYFTCPITLDERMPYFMFSVDIRPEAFASRRLNGVHLYVNSMCGEHTPTALSYLLSEQGFLLENHYAFFDAGKEMHRVIKKVRCSATADLSDVGLQHVILPEVYDCFTICIANKSICDTIYFSRVRVDQFADFLARMEYPPAMREFVDEHRLELDHLYTCVGFDYAVRGGELKVLKSGFYGTF